jgi:hypothetical protein
MIRSDLVAALSRRRDTDVYVHVPLESGGAARLKIADVFYDETTDTVVILTDEYLDLPEENQPEGNTT